MRHVNQTTVNVVVNDRLDRTNVVETRRDNSQRLRLCLREACSAKALAKRIAQPGFEAMYVASAGSPSWGGHRTSGGPGHLSRS
jgi:hypothetical protein